MVLRGDSILQRQGVACAAAKRAVVGCGSWRTSIFTTLRTEILGTKLIARFVSKLTARTLARRVGPLRKNIERSRAPSNCGANRTFWKLVAAREDARSFLPRLWVAA